ncbi:MAG: hypothetical protein AAFX81_17600 [Pseudomonadota bacterium]
MRWIMVASIAFAAAAFAAEWRVGDVDAFGWRRAVVASGEHSLTLLCPPDAAMLAVPASATVDPHHRQATTLVLEIDGNSYASNLNCLDDVCAAELTEEAVGALRTGDAVTVWFDDERGPSFPLTGAADALVACSAETAAVTPR